MNGLLDLLPPFLARLLRDVIQDVIDSEENQDGVQEAIENQVAEAKRLEREED